MSLAPLNSLLAAVVVLLIGTLINRTLINRKVSLLSKYNISDPITGALLFAVLASGFGSQRTPGVISCAPMRLSRMRSRLARDALTPATARLEAHPRVQAKD